MLNPGPKLTLGVGVSMSTFTHASAIAAVLETTYSAYWESIAKAGVGSTKNWSVVLRAIVSSCRRSSASAWRSDRRPRDSAAERRTERRDCGGNSVSKRLMAAFLGTLKTKKPARMGTRKCSLVPAHAWQNRPARCQAVPSTRYPTIRLSRPTGDASHLPRITRRPISTRRSPSRQVTMWGLVFPGQTRQRRPGQVRGSRASPSAHNRRTVRTPMSVASPVTGSIASIRTSFKPR